MSTSLSRRACAQEGCGKLARKGRRRCDDHTRTRAGHQRPSRTAERPDGRGARASVYACLTEAEWRKLYEHQSGRCNICERQLMNRYDPGSTEGHIAYLDHSHAREKVAGLRASLRGLLCYHCNRNILVALGDNAHKAWRTYQHLTAPPAPAILEL